MGYVDAFGIDWPGGFMPSLAGETPGPGARTIRRNLGSFSHIKVPRMDMAIT